MNCGLRSCLTLSSLYEAGAGRAWTPLLEEPVMTCGGRDLLSPLSTSSRHACTTFYSRNSKLHFSAGRGSARCLTLCRQDDHGQRRLFVLLCVAGAFDIRYLRYRAFKQFTLFTVYSLLRLGFKNTSLPILETRETRYAYFYTFPGLHSLCVKL